MAVVTGGASGIGRMLCEELADRGVVVVVADIDEGGAWEVASSICGQGGQAQAQSVDVSSEEGIRRLVRDSTAAHGRLDYMFNNAGIVITGDIRDLRTEHWRRMLDVDLWSVIHGTSEAYAVMADQGHGHIVNTASLAGLVPDPTNPTQPPNTRSSGSRSRCGPGLRSWESRSVSCVPATSNRASTGRSRS